MSRPGALESGEKIVEMTPLSNEDNDDNCEVVTMQVPENRVQWDNKLQFLLGVVSMAVGLGNVWRFPYLCQQNGGGAFLIPYVIMLFLEGMPLNLIEMGLGQRMRQGSVGVWNSIHPFIGGLGLCSAIVSFFVGLYYNVVIAWCFWYFFNSFGETLPWADCPSENGTTVEECEMSSSTAYFWYRKTIDASDAIENPVEIKWWMALTLLLAWAVVYLCIMRGIQSSGKVMYFTALFPYLVLIIFFVRGVTLKGAGVGLHHMITPKMDRLLDPKVWMDAATQVFYSMSLAFGGLIAYSSYNPPKNNCLQDAYVTSAINLATSLFTCIVIFSVLGFKAVTNYDNCLDHQIKKIVPYLEENPGILTFNLTINGTLSHEDYLDIYNRHLSEEHREFLHLKECDLQKELDQAAEGTGLAFIVFTQAIVELPIAPFWSIIFFLMLLALGLGSQFGTMEGVVTNLFDVLAGFRIRKEVLTGVLCIFCFFVDLTFVSGAGEYWVKLVDSFAGTTGLILIAFFEAIFVAYVYGWRKFSDDIENMTGTRPGLYWQLTWRLISPLIIAVIFISSIINTAQNKPSYHAWHKETGETVETEYPTWAIAVGSLMVFINILPLPLVFILRYFKLFRADTNIHQASVKRIDTTISTTGMMQDMDDNWEEEHPPVLASGFSRIPAYHDTPDRDLDEPSESTVGQDPSKVNFRIEVMDS